jgi:hypothetical protein
LIGSGNDAPNGDGNDQEIGGGLNHRLEHRNC